MDGELLFMISEELKEAFNNTKMIKLRPAFKNLIWGGTRLKTDFLLDTPYEHTAEALLLSSCEGYECTAAGGAIDGMTLSEMFAEFPDFFGENCKKYDRFPLLIKLIDTMDDISVQVHPDDEYAMSVSNDWGKAQLWHVVDCEQGAYLVCGFKEDITIDDFRRRIEDDTLISAVNTYEVSRGDTFNIEPGTLHAIGQGIVIAEIGQNSELSYRVYDYGRLDENGESRPLNIQQALDVTITAPPTLPTGPMGERLKKDSNFETLLGESEYYSATLWEITENDNITAIPLNPKSFISLIMIDGTLNINNDELFVRKGESVLFGASDDMVSVSGVGKFIAVSAL